MHPEPVAAATADARRSLADDLQHLLPPQWATPSLCAGWDVRTVVAHLVSALEPKAGPFLLAVLRSGGPHRANTAVARRVAQQPTTDLVEALRRGADAVVAPPVTGPRGALTDVLVHSGDIRLPLGLPHDPAAEGVRAALDFVTTGRPVGFVPRRRLHGLRLVAEDLDGAWGAQDGAVVAGRGIDLLMAACGRTAVLPQLHGEGASVLASRLGG